MRACPVPQRWRLSALIGLVLASFAVLHGLWPHAYRCLTHLPDGALAPHPFPDTHDILAAGACWRQGVDVYHPSACLHGGVFNYSPVLLRLSILPLGPADTLAVGLGFCTGFALSLALLPRPASRAGRLALAAACLSPASLYALGQGNLDLVIFALVALALRLPAGPRYLLFGLAAAAKFYPAALFAFALREGKTLRRALLGAGALGLLVVLALFGSGIRAALLTIPSGTPFRASFGRIDLPRGLLMLHRLPGLAALHGAALAGLWSWLLAAAALAAAFALRPWAARHLRLPEAERQALLAGAFLTCFCFLMAQNIEYRAIFLLLALPGLLRTLPWVAALALALLWEALPRALVGGFTQPYLPPPALFQLWLLREAGWWALFTLLAALSLAFVTAAKSR